MFAGWPDAFKSRTGLSPKHVVDGIVETWLTEFEMMGSSCESPALQWELCDKAYFLTLAMVYVDLTSVTGRAGKEKCWCGRYCWVICKVRKFFGCFLMLWGHGVDAFLRLAAWFQSSQHSLLLANNRATEPTKVQLFASGNYHEIELPWLLSILLRHVSAEKQSGFRHLLHVSGLSRSA